MVHSDIGTENTLTDIGRDKKQRVVLSDFGLSRDEIQHVGNMFPKGMDDSDAPYYSTKHRDIICFCELFKFIKPYDQHENLMLMMA